VNANVPYLYLSFTVSHLVHLVALVVWAVLYPKTFFPDLQLYATVSGAILYGFIALIAYQAWRGRSTTPLTLTRLARAGLYFLWLAFLVSFITRAQGRPTYIILAVLSVVALVIRLSPIVFRPNEGKNDA